VESFVDQPPHTPAQAEHVRARVMAVPHDQRSLVAPDGSATFIVTELLEPAQAAVYDALVALLHAAPVMEETLQLKVPGQPLVTTTPHPHKPLF
jgi:hypothetical protein